MEGVCSSAFCTHGWGLCLCVLYDVHYCTRHVYAWKGFVAVRSVRCALLFASCPYPKKLFNTLVYKLIEPKKLFNTLVYQLIEPKKLSMLLFTRKLSYSIHIVNCVFCI